MTEAQQTAQHNAALNLRWLIERLAEEVPGVRQVVLVSSDGLMLTSAGPDGDRAGDLAAVVSGMIALSRGAADLLETGAVRQEIIAMSHGHLVAMSISDGSCLGVHAGPEADLGVVAYQMSQLVRRAGHVLTPALRAHLHQERTDVVA
jgi:predicted regulator of Ras-like GTPase activity (Roadblock/LC7/MglB family)